VATRKYAEQPLVASSSAILAIAFSPDGKLLATSDETGTVKVWNVTTKKSVGAAMHSTGTPATLGIGGLAFSPDGTTLAAADNDGSVQLWNISTDKTLGGPLPAALISLEEGDSSSVNYSLAISPNGNLLATGDYNGAVELWNLSLFSDPYKALCDDEPPLSKTDWGQYAPGEPYPATICR
jgi:WD40 repeat protein